MSSDPSPRQVAKQVVSNYRQMNECLITNVEFLEGRIATAISNAVEDEREECAKVAESLENQAQLIHDASVFNYIDVAKAIRARGSKKEVRG